MAWHGLTEINKELTLTSPDLWLRRWEVTPVKIVAMKDDGTVVTPEGQNWQALVTEQELVGPSPLFVSTPFNRDTYTPLSNAEFIRIVSESLSAAGIPDTVESCGSVFSRRRVFLSIPVPGGEEFEAGERRFRGFLNFVNSFDGSCEFGVIYSNICIVCNNTFSANLDVGGCFIPHTKNMAARLVGVPNIVSAAMAIQEKFRVDFLKLAGREVSIREARALFASFLSKDSAVSLSTRSFNQAERLVSLFVRGAGNKGENLADFFSAGTDLYTHESAGEDKAKQFQSSEFGSGAQSKRELLSFCRDILVNAAFEKEFNRGETLLNAYHSGVKAKLDAKAQAKLSAPVGTVSVVDTIPADATPTAPTPPPALPAPAASKPAKGKGGKGKAKK